MNEHDRFSVPHEIDEILERLPPQVTLNVPDHILSLWFPPRGPSTASWKDARSRALKATRKAAPAGSRITAAPMKGSSISRCRREIEPQESAQLRASHQVPRIKGMIDMRRKRAYAARALRRNEHGPVI